eukprot:m51a1_g2617 hypothetical protein (402) ;mRNA; r:522567-524083
MLSGGPCPAPSGAGAGVDIATKECAKFLEAHMRASEWSPVISALAPMTRAELDDVAAHFIDEFGHDVHESVAQKAEPGLFASLMGYWLLGPVYTSVRVLESLEESRGLLTRDESLRYLECLIDMAALDNSMMQGVLEYVRAVAMTGPKNIALSAVDKIVGKMDPNLSALFYAAFEGKRIRDDALVQSDAERILRLQSSSELIDIVGHRTPSHLAHVNKYLVEHATRNLADIINTSVHGNFKELVIALVLPRDKYYAKLLKKGIEDKHGLHRCLERIFSANDKEGMVAVLKAYHRLYNDDPLDRIPVDPKSRQLIKAVCHSTKPEDDVMDPFFRLSNWEVAEVEQSRVRTGSLSRFIFDFYELEGNQNATVTTSQEVRIAIPDIRTPSQPRHTGPPVMLMSA